MVNQNLKLWHLNNNENYNYNGKVAVVYNPYNFTIPGTQFLNGEKMLSPVIPPKSFLIFNNKRETHRAPIRRRNQRPSLYRTNRNQLNYNENKYGEYNNNVINIANNMDQLKLHSKKRQSTNIESKKSLNPSRRKNRLLLRHRPPFHRLLPYRITSDIIPIYNKWGFGPPM